MSENKALRWVNAYERLPKRPDNYPFTYEDENEPQILFVNRVHDCCFVWYLSMGWDIATHQQLSIQMEGWSLSQWEWLESYTPDQPGIDRESDSAENAQSEIPLGATEVTFMDLVEEKRKLQAERDEAIRMQQKYKDILVVANNNTKRRNEKIAIIEADRDLYKKESESHFKAWKEATDILEGKNLEIAEMKEERDAYRRALKTFAHVAEEEYVKRISREVTEKYSKKEEEKLK